MPVTITWNIPAEAKLHERVELPVPVTLIGESVHEVLLVARLTMPAKPFSPVTEIVEAPAVPASKVTLVRLAAIVKSWTM